MTTMLNVITRLGLPGNSTLENRFLSVDIASTLFYWDDLASRDKMDADPVETRPSQQALDSGDQALRVDTSRLTAGMNEMIVNFLLRMAFVRYKSFNCYLLFIYVCCYLEHVCTSTISLQL
jgi:hypothetical protein